MRILAVNEGSSSLKLSVIGDGDETLATENIALGSGADSDAHADSATRRLIQAHGPIDAAGHRIVHGGTEFTGPVLLTAPALERIRALTDLAPLHQAKSLHGVELVSRVLPDVPAVGCFDTAFHAHMPPAASTYALPQAWRTRWPLRRFGFHGLSHAWSSARVAALLQRDVHELRIVTCHLGSGASLCAVHDGQSVDTTMGFTPLEGLVMATRSGSVDPGLVLWLQQHAGVAPSEVSDTLENRSGVLGLAGTADMRAVVASAAAGDERAGLAVDVYVHRLRAAIAAMAAGMNGLDALVFTGGVGEGSSEIRARAAAGLGFLGVRLDAARNTGATGDSDIGASDAEVRVFVITAREDLEMAAQVRDVLAPVARPS
ncbi:MAG: acetate/propionate family kinase [Candidatus Dormibacteraeota bacterium]|nr:acetate/propionate family kinase [Candidatus Dormibacteraeota bacterium]